MRSNMGSFSVNGKRTIICVFAVAQGQWANSLTSERIHWLHIENNNRIKMLEVAESMFTCLNQWYVHVKWLNYQLFTYLSDMSMLSAAICQLFTCLNQWYVNIICQLFSLCFPVIVLKDLYHPFKSAPIYTKSGADYDLSVHISQNRNLNKELELHAVA